MNAKSIRTNLIRVGLIIAIFLLVPYTAPFAIEAIILLDLAAVDSLLMLLLCLSRNTFYYFELLLKKFETEIRERTLGLSHLHLFQSKRLFWSNSTGHFNKR